MEKEPTDKLKRWIRDNRQELDELEPGKDIWQQLESKLPGQASGMGTIHRIRNFRLAVAVAAGLLLLFVAGWSVLVPLLHARGSSAPGGLASRTDEVSAYTATISLKATEVKRIRTVNPGLYDDFSGDLARLQQNYTEIKNQLPRSENRKILQAALIQNLRLQIGLLNSQLQIIQNISTQQSTSSHANLQL